jgi:hypothetical protein
MLAHLPVARRLPKTLSLVPAVSSSTGAPTANSSVTG